EEEGEPVQRICRSGDLSLAVVDLSPLPPEGRQAESARQICAEALRPFDLSRGPLLRARLLRLAPEGHALLLTLHHIVSDGWSTEVLLGEVGTLYEAFLEGRPATLPALAVQYADYAEWQRNRFAGEALESELSYWRTRLAGLPPRLDLPVDRPRPPVQAHRGSARPLTLDPQLVADLRRLGRREGVTVFMLLLAGWQALLGRYAKSEDPVVGTPIAGRNRWELERLVGFFVNTLVMRGDLSGSPSFRELLGRVRQVALEAHDHQEVPFERLVEELAPERSLSHAPLFQVLFLLQNAPRTSLKLPGMRLKPLETGIQVTKFDLTLGLVDEGGRIVGGLGYDTDLFDGATACRILVHFSHLLSAACSHPDRPLSDLAALAAAERHQILREWNDTGGKDGGAAQIHELFARQVAVRPDSVCLVWGEEQVSYGALGRRVGRLARRLRRLGVGPESVVGVCLERKPELVVALLAVLAAGGAYLPLDPAYPPERLALMLEDAGARVVIRRADGVAVLPGTVPVCSVEEAADVADDDAGDVAQAWVRLDPENLAW